MVAGPREVVDELAHRRRSRSDHLHRVRGEDVAAGFASGVVGRPDATPIGPHEGWVVLPATGVGVHRVVRAPRGRRVGHSNGLHFEDRAGPVEEGRELLVAAGCGGGRDRVGVRAADQDRRRSGHGVHAVPVLRNELLDVEFSRRRRADRAERCGGRRDVVSARGVPRKLVARHFDVEVRVVAGAGGERGSGPRAPAAGLKVDIGVCGVPDVGRDNVRGCDVAGVANPRARQELVRPVGDLVGVQPDDVPGERRERERCGGAGRPDAHEDRCGGEHQREGCPEEIASRTALRHR